MQNENGKVAFDKPPTVNIRVVTEWFRKIPLAKLSPTSRFWIGYIGYDEGMKRVVNVRWK